jgi:hypothetical protein
MLLLTLLTVIFFIDISAQSDYEKTQNFKTRYTQLADAIKNAVSLDECEAIGINIAKLKEDFILDKSLLDKTLYPDNFESSFLKIESALVVRKGDFTQIVQLTSEVGTLKTQVTELSQKNQDLIGQIRQLNLKVDKDAATIASLQNLIAQLKNNIQQRDLLVRDIVDSLLTEFVNAPSTLNEAEKQNFISKIDSRNLFYNIERTISDNIQFMRVTRLMPEDLSEMKKQYNDFNKVWKQIGPKIAEVYLSKREKAVEIANIDNMFNDWNQRINEEIWTQVNKLFREKQISILQFNSGEQFTNNTVSFIDDQMKNLGVKSSEESEKVFFTFTDSVYFPKVEPTWIPVLIENNMMTQVNKDTIESRIAMWKEKVAPSTTFNWYYVALIAIIAVLIAAYFMKGRKKPKIEAAE